MLAIGHGLCCDSSIQHMQEEPSNSTAAVKSLAQMDGLALHWQTSFEERVRPLATDDAILCLFLNLESAEALLNRKTEQKLLNMPLCVNVRHRLVR